jgi:hypothetical protein
MAQGKLPRADGEGSMEQPQLGDPYNRRPDAEHTARRRTLDDMRKLSEEIKSVRSRGVAEANRPR